MTRITLLCVGAEAHTVHTHRGSEALHAVCGHPGCHSSLSAFRTSREEVAWVKRGRRNGCFQGCCHFVTKLKGFIWRELEVLQIRYWKSLRS